MNLLVSWLILCIFGPETEVLAKVRGVPGVDYSNYSSIPKTSFKCSDQFYIPGFYADVETKCQVFHHCYEHRKESFLCPEGTAFNQEIQSCDYWYSFDCDSSQKSDRQIKKSQYKDAPFLPVKIQNTSSVYEKMVALYDPTESTNLSFLHDSSSMSRNEDEIDAFKSPDRQYFKNSVNIRDGSSFKTIQSDINRNKQSESNIFDNSKYENIISPDGANIVLLDGISLNLLDDSNGFVPVDKITEILGESKAEKYHNFDENQSSEDESVSEMRHQLDIFDNKKSKTEDSESVLSDGYLIGITDPHEMLVKRLSEKEVSRKKLRRKPKYVILQTHEPELEFSNKNDPIEKPISSVKGNSNIDSLSNIFTYNEDETNKHLTREVNIISTFDKPKRKRKPIELLTAGVEKPIETISTSPLMTVNVMDTFFITANDQENSVSAVDNKNIFTEKTSSEATDINQSIENVKSLSNKSSGISESLENIEIYKDSSDLLNTKQFEVHKVNETEHYFSAQEASSDNFAIESTKKKIEFNPEHIKKGRYLDNSFEHEKLDRMKLIVENSEKKSPKINESAEGKWVLLDLNNPEYENTESNKRNEVFTQEIELTSEEFDGFDADNHGIDDSIFSMDNTEYLENDNDNKMQQTMHYNSQLIDEESEDFSGLLEEVSEIDMELDALGENVRADFNENSINDNQLEYLSYQELEDNYDEDPEVMEDENIDSHISISSAENPEDTKENLPLIEDISIITEEQFVSGESEVTPLEDLQEEGSERLNVDLENRENLVESSEIDDFTINSAHLSEKDILEAMNDANVFDTKVEELEYEDEAGSMAREEEKSSYFTSQNFDLPKENLPLTQIIGVEIPESHYAHSELEKSIDSTFHTSSMPLPTNTYERNLYLQNIRQDQKTLTNGISYPSFYKELKAGTVTNENLPEILKNMFEASQTASTRKKLSSKKDGIKTDTPALKGINLNDRNSIKTTDDSEFSTSPFFDNRRSTNRLKEMLPSYLSEIKRNEVLSSRIGKMSKPAKFKKLISFGKKLLAMKRAKLNMLRKFLKSFTNDNF